MKVVYEWLTGLGDDKERRALLSRSEFSPNGAQSDQVVEPNGGPPSGT